MNSNNPRKTAIEILINIEENQAYSNLELAKINSNDSFSSVDKRFIRQLVLGVLENKIYLDYIIDNLSKTKLNKIDSYILNILRLGLYQIIFLDKIPNSASVNESVKIAKKYNYRLSGFVNGILRNYIRNSKNIRFPNPKNNRNKYLSIKYSHPQWIVDKWVEDFGLEFTEALLNSNNNPPSLTVRTNTLKISRENLINTMNKYNIICKKGIFAKESILIEELNTNIQDLDSYNKGLFQVQDESSMIVGHVLSPNENDFIIDVCSAPGGKATHLAQLMNNKGKILSRDIHSHKLKLINENSKRLGINIIQTEKFDGLTLDPTLVNKADKVLIDAPCSGFGIIRRKPEIRYFKCAKNLLDLQEIQYKMITINSKYVKVNGILVYSTCTIQKEENNYIIDRFLKENDDFILEDINQYLPKNLLSNSKTLQLYPNIHNSDGFFVSRLKKIK